MKPIASFLPPVTVKTKSVATQYLSSDVAGGLLPSSQMTQSTLGKNPAILNIEIGKVYDQRYLEDPIHCESFSKLAEFFGRNMPVHRHDRFFQLHYLKSGQIHLYLEQQQYVLRAPLFFMTPPTVPHAFITEDDADGYVLTLRQELVWRLLEGLPGLVSQERFMQPFCVELHSVPVALETEAQRLPQWLAQLFEEFVSKQDGRSVALQSLTQLALVSLIRLAGQAQPHRHFRRDELQVYHRFNTLIEEHYRKHWSLEQYAEQMRVTAARLNDICRRMANLSSKQLIHDRLLVEAKRLLVFSGASVHEIAYALGFKDPAYFSRFFTRLSGFSPSEYRARDSV